MKHLLRNMIGIFAVTLFVLLFYACEQDPQIKKYEYPMPEVSGMSPNIGYVSSQVVITGTNFGDRTEPVKVFFGSVLATKVLMCKNNRIVVEVPDGAASGDVTMQIWTNDVGVIGQYKVLPTPYVHSVVSDNPLGTGVAERLPVKISERMLMTLKLVLTGHQLRKYDWWMSLPSKLSLPEIGFPVMWLLQFADML